MSITYQRETMAEALDDMRPLFPDHWKELALNQQSIKLSPDIGRYLEMERKGGLHLFTAREDGKLIGYYVSVMQDPSALLRKSHGCQRYVLFAPRTSERLDWGGAICRA